MSANAGHRESSRSLRERFVENFLMPRPWHGMTMSVWLRLLARNRFAVSPRKLPMAAMISGCSVGNSVLAGYDRIRHGRRVRHTELDHPPLFLLGHWRSGTTLLHELFSEDDQYTSPTVYETMAPAHFVATGRVLPPIVDSLMPSKRPMDDVALGLDRPMEDEFALCNLGSPSPYLAWAWPNVFSCGSYLDLDECTDGERQRWKQNLLTFLKRLQIVRPGRALLKSPPHTARIRYLKELFPDAQFVHIVRHPLSVFPSCMKTWKRMQAITGLQIPTYDGLDEQVLETFTRMYDCFDRDRPLVADQDFCELRYEDLIEDPVKEVSRIYRHLNLGDVDVVTTKVQHYMEARRDYRPGRYDLPAECRQQIMRRWGPYVQRHGYRFDDAA